MFLLPAVALIGVFLVYPIIENIRIGFYDWNGIGRPKAFVGLANFLRVIQDPYFWNAVRNTVVFVGATVSVGIPIAFSFAILLNNPRLRGRTVLRTIIFIPVVTSGAVLGIVIGMLLNPVAGPLSSLPAELGLTSGPVNLLGASETALGVVIAVTVWQGLGVGLVIFLAGLQSIPNDLYDAASVDGASALQRHRHITLPAMGPLIGTVALLSMLGGVAAFDLVLTLTGGGPFFASEVVSTYIYRYAFGIGFGFSSSQLGYAAAAAVFVSVLTLVLTGTYLAFRRRMQRDHG